MCTRALVAQGIEHRSPKAGVGRSNRPGGTRKHRRSDASAPGLLFCSLSLPSALEVEVLAGVEALLAQVRVEKVAGPRSDAEQVDSHAQGGESLGRDALGREL